MIPATPHIKAALDALPYDNDPEVAERGSQARRDYLNLQTMLRRAYAQSLLIERKQHAALHN